MKKFLAIFLLHSATAHGVSAQPDFRLGDAATPGSYALRLAIDPAETTFSGDIRIAFRFNRAAPVLWLNATGIEVAQVELTQGGKRVDVNVLRTPEDFVGFEAKDGAFAAGDAVATIRFRGDIEPLDTRGLFRQQEGGDWYVISQLESMNARRAFPCFDEPGWKTPWQVTIDAPAGNVVVGNTPETSAIDLPDRPGWKRHAFATTKPLPSYLVAMAVGPFDVVDGGVAGARRTPLRYLAPRGRGAEMRYVKEVTPRLLEILEDYFGRPYPFEKLDAVTIPATVNFGAMENVGMITYASGLVLAKQHEESATFMRRYAAIAAHEIAHMWFGNLVTLAWWDDTWLNEAFATWAGRKTVEKFRPEWSAGWQAFDRRRKAQLADRLESARRVHNPVLVKGDVDGAFDAITYDKGGEVLAMFETWLGEARFQKGVRDYLDKHAYGNTTSADFFAALGEASGRPEVARRAFEAFIDQPGIPLVDVAMRCEGSVRSSTASLEAVQQRLRPAGSTAPDAQWVTPACFAYSAEGVLKTQCAEVGNGDRVIPLAGARGCPDWALGNARGAGYYVTRYPASALARLGERAAQLPEREAMALAGDTLLLAQSGLVAKDDALLLARSLLAHRSAGVRHGSVELLEKLRDDLLSRQEARLRAGIVAGPVQAVAREMGWRERMGDRDAARELRAALLRFAARSDGGAPLRREARELALRWLSEPESVDAMMVPAVLDTAARFADEPTYARLEAALLAATERRRRTDLLKALAKVRDPALRERTYRLAMGKEVDGREALSFFEEAMRDDFNRGAAFAFVRGSFEALVTKLPAETPGQFTSYVSELCTPEDRAQYVAFFKERSPKFLGGTLRYDQALESIDLCIAARSHLTAATNSRPLSSSLSRAESKPPPMSSITSLP